MWKLIVVLTFPLIGGCAITSMNAKIAPDMQIAADSIGEGHEVGVVVIDERPTQNIGKRSAVGANIKMQDDLAAIYQQALMDGLARKGFAPVPGESPEANLRVEIRSLSYEVSGGWWTGGINIDSAIKAYVIGPLETYEHLYRASDSDRAVFALGAGTNNEKLNAAVEETLHQVFEDQKLLEVLTAPANVVLKLE